MLAVLLHLSLLHVGWRRGVFAHSHHCGSFTGVTVAYTGRVLCQGRFFSCRDSDYERIDSGDKFLPVVTEGHQGSLVYKVCIRLL